MAFSSEFPLSKALRMPPIFDVAVVGGGIVGLATAREVQQCFPRSSVVVLEKERSVCSHQSGRNSGVVHSGVYYRPGTLKARLCVEGGRLLKAYCAEKKLPLELCGKVIVATRPHEIPRLEEIHLRAQANGVPGAALIDAGHLRELEPHAAGLRALHVPGAAVTDFRAIGESFAAEVRRAGGEVRLAARFEHRREETGATLLRTPSDELRARRVINCGGLHADRIARRAGVRSGLKLVPFRGEFYEVLRPALVRGLIYPVPDPAFPFLGVHFKTKIGGGVQAGPNAVPALAREGYRWRDINLRDLLDTLGHRGFWSLSFRYWRTGAYEMLRSLHRGVFLRDLQRLVPEVEAADLRPAASGVRAQAVDGAGNMLDDFRIVQQERWVHVLNAPSPAATASLAIAQEIVRCALGAELHGPGRGPEVSP